MNDDAIEELREELGGEGRVGLLWLDFGDGDRLDEVLLDKGYWDLVDPNGGIVLVHSTLTNAASRDWLARMENNSTTGASAAVPRTDGGTAAAAEAEAGDLGPNSQPGGSKGYGPFEMMSLMEPHKMRQNSVTMIRRKGLSAAEPYVEPVFTAFA